MGERPNELDENTGQGGNWRRGSQRGQSHDEGKLRWPGRSVGRAQDRSAPQQRQRRLAFGQVVADIFAHGGGRAAIVERIVDKLESENDQLRLESRQLKQKLDAQERDLAKLDELKLHNQQLVRTVEAIESSRQEYEADAERYREQADQSEKESDTLRLKLEDLERSFADIEKQQHEALEDVRNDTVVPIMRKQR